MKILITGAWGQLGNELQVLSGNYPQHQFHFTDIDTLDITSTDAIHAFFSANHPEAVINCAAYTAVDKAEQEPEKARLVNAVATSLLAQACKEFRSLLIHISTDYVFDGKGYRPYVETDPVNPVSVYALTKWAAEEEIRKTGGNAIIIRTSWLYSSFGNNFVKTMMKYGRERGLLNVVFDQVGTPTYARDLADAILKILSSQRPVTGIETYHYSNEGVLSWYDFAKAITELSGISCVINPILTSEYPLPASRPFYSVLNKAKIKQRFDLKIPFWKDSLKDCLLLIK
jgi:dTDP-4-dehydrorhamnose reductase